jgi:hypothetical protein
MRMASIDACETRVAANCPAGEIAGFETGVRYDVG